MRKILLLAPDYPSLGNLYGNAFVHTRVKGYLHFARMKVVVFFKDERDYEFDGVQVNHAASIEQVLRIYGEFRPDEIFIHFYNRRLFDLIKIVNVPVVIWVHGYEALGWYRRLFNFTVYGVIRNFHSITLDNIKQMLGLRKLFAFANERESIHFIFVSNWMKRVAETDTCIRLKNYSIIPNPINIDLFRYRRKTVGDRKKILMIRSFSSRKYANDKAVKAILILSKKSFFNDLEFSIYGKGKYFSDLTFPLKGFRNVKLYETFLHNQSIPEVHKQNGIFLCPTRQDAQGVSMCEAMASGLVPLSSNTTAIPEFVSHMATGVLTNSSSGLAKHIEYLYYNSGIFLSISNRASIFINEKCSISNIIERELSIFNDCYQEHLCELSK